MRLGLVAIALLPILMACESRSSGDRSDADKVLKPKAALTCSEQLERQFGPDLTSAQKSRLARQYCKPFRQTNTASLKSQSEEPSVRGSSVVSERIANSILVKFNLGGGFLPLVEASTKKVEQFKKLSAVVGETKASQALHRNLREVGVTGQANWNRATVKALTENFSQEELLILLMKTNLFGDPLFKSRSPGFSQSLGKYLGSTAGDTGATALIYTIRELAPDLE